MLVWLDAVFRICFTPLAVFITRAFFDLEIEGARAIPRRGPVLVVANHQGYLDPLFLQMATSRPIRYMMTEDFFDVPAVRPFFRMVGAISVKEGGPHRNAVAAALAVLRAGGVVGVFPEGRLSLDGALGPPAPGIVLLAGRSGARVVPARIRGSFRVLPRGSFLPRQAGVSVRFGAPMFFPDPKDRTAAKRISQAWLSL